MRQLPMHTSVLCMSMHVCYADQMLRSHLQGALISCMFTVTDGQQGASRPLCRPSKDEWHRLQRTPPPRQPANTPTRSLLTYAHTCGTCFSQCWINNNDQPTFPQVQSLQYTWSQINYYVILPIYVKRLQTISPIHQVSLYVKQSLLRRLKTWFNWVVNSSWLVSFHPRKVNSNLRHFEEFIANAITD